MPRRAQPVVGAADTNLVSGVGYDVDRNEDRSVQDSPVPNLLGDRIVAFYTAVDMFAERLRERELGHWADCLHDEMTKARNAADAMLRGRQVLVEIATRY